MYEGTWEGGGRDGRVFGFIKDITYHWAGCQVSSGSYNSFGDSHRKQGEQRRINLSLHVDKQGTVCINISLNRLSSVSTRTHSDRYELIDHGSMAQNYYRHSDSWREGGG